MTNYKHDELEGPGEIGSLIENDEWETRIEARHGDIGPLNGAFGVQFGSRESVASGEEGFIPFNDVDRFGVFLFEELGEGPVRLQAGARYETQSAISEGVEPDHEGLSASVGVNWQAADGLSFALSGARSVKLPSGEELFSDGPHAATRQFEVGSADLDEEVAYSVDVGARYRQGRFTGQVNFFANTFNDFIFQAFTGEEEDGFAVVEYAQQDADFVGFEWLTAFEVLHLGDRHVDLEFSGDWVPCGTGGHR